MHAASPATVEIREVGPRDGLQNEDPIPVDDRVRLIDALSATGLRRIEAASFVKAEAIPADGGRRGRHGPDRAPARGRVLGARAEPAGRGAGARRRRRRAQVVVSASETHNRKNVRRSIDESIERGRRGRRARPRRRHAGRGDRVDFVRLPVRGRRRSRRVSPVSRSRLSSRASTAARSATPPAWRRPAGSTSCSTPLERRRIVATDVGLHFHNTRGTGLANVLAGLERGVARFDASIGGLGGCPYAPGATGNIVTEDLVHMLDDIGVETGVDLDSAHRRCPPRPGPGRPRAARSGHAGRDRAPRRCTLRDGGRRPSASTSSGRCRATSSGKRDKLAATAQAVRARPARPAPRRRLVRRGRPARQRARR